MITKLNELNINFQSGEVLYAQDLNTVVSNINTSIRKVNSIINLLNSEQGQNGGNGGDVSQELQDRLSELEDLVNQLKESLDGQDGIQSKIVELENGIGLIAGKIERGEVVGNPAAIIAAINDSGESVVGINADKITISGDTVLTSCTLAEKLSAIDLEVQNLKSSSAQIDQAAIKQAVINDLNATNLYLGGGTSAFSSDGSGMLANNNISWTANGNVTINGTLHYNRIVGNTVSVSSSTTLNNDAYFVMYTGTGSQPYPVITLPSNPITGQTLFLEVGNRYFNIKASHNMRIYMMEYDQNNAATGNAVRDTIQAGQERLVSSLSWNGVVQFIFDGTQWIQLTHNISL